MTVSPCLCGSMKLMDECCLPFLSGIIQPETALNLMRSRYTAYCLRDGQYLQRTWHVSTRPAKLDFQGDDTEWVRLDIVGQELGENSDTLGRVEFVALYRQGGQLKRLHESSRFVKEEGEWFYVDGDIKPDVKPGRNDPCFCGSGKKYKKCCAVQI